MKLDTKNPKTHLENLAMRLELRLLLFNRVPSATNMLLAYSLMEELTLQSYKELRLDLNEKLLDKFDKCKNLALGTKVINERVAAFMRSHELFKKLLNLNGGSSNGTSKL